MSLFILPKGFGGDDVRDGSSQIASATDGQTDGVISSDANRQSIARRHSISLHSGLKCTWIAGWPVVPVASTRSRINGTAKRLLDVVVSGSALLVLSPFLLSIALTIKLTDRGPVLFRQERVGYKNRPFKLLKFRTMHHHLGDHTGVEQTRKDDQRVTGFGRFLRKTSLDELPQLINILRGDMSVAGPRPHVRGQLAAGLPYKHAVPYYDLRCEAKPGLTGWAQMNGHRGPTDDRARAIARIEHDMAYVQNQSVWLDVRIIALTVWREFVTGSGH